MARLLHRLLRRFIAVLVGAALMLAVVQMLTLHGMPDVRLPDMTAVWQFLAELSVEQWIGVLGLLANVAMVHVTREQLLAVKEELENTVSQKVEEEERRRREASLGYSTARNSYLREALNAIERLFPPEVRAVVSLDRLDEYFRTEPALRGALCAMFGVWENMALSCARAICSEDMCFEMWGAYLVAKVDQFRPFIERVREGRPKAYQYLLQLAERWRQRLAEESMPTPKARNRRGCGVVLLVIAGLMLTVAVQFLAWFALNR